MRTLEHLLPMARLVELDQVDLAAPPARVWQLVRHGDLARSPLVRALFALRTLPDRLAGHPGAAVTTGIHIDDLLSSPERPGFHMLADEPPHEVTVGAIGKVWQLDIPFVHVPDAAAFESFAEPGFVKVAWAVRVLPRGDVDTRVEIEVRVDATDEESWRAFRRYFRVIGPASRFIRRIALAGFVRDLGLPEAQEDERPLPGDDLLPDAAGQLTHGITIAARPQQIWPWLVQMGCRRAGFYSIDWLDNAGVASARELHDELQTLRVGDVIPARPEGDDGFEVLRIEAPRVLVLGGLYDVAAGRQQRFAAPRPQRFWQVSWAFVLEPLDEHTTRLHVRARGAFAASERLHAAWIRPVHHLMETAQLRHLAARAEGRLPRDDVHHVLEGLGGVAIMALAFLTPFLRRARNHWGLAERDAARAYPGDGVLAEPRWQWTHAVEIDRPAAAVWPWVAQMGADRAGFYSYQWLENLAGCELRNAERIHPDWVLRKGDALHLHPRMPALRIVEVEAGHYLVAHAAADEAARAAGKPWIEGSWLFLVEPLGEAACRFISRFRSASWKDVASSLASGPVLLEPVGFTMDRRMLLGVKARAEGFADGLHEK